MKIHNTSHSLNRIGAKFSLRKWITIQLDSEFSKFNLYAHANCSLFQYLSPSHNLVQNGFVRASNACAYTFKNNLSTCTKFNEVEIQSFKSHFQVFRKILYQQMFPCIGSILEYKLENRIKNKWKTIKCQCFTNIQLFDFHNRCK